MIIIVTLTIFFSFSFALVCLYQFIEQQFEMVATLLKYKNKRVQLQSPNQFFRSTFIQSKYIRHTNMFYYILRKKNFNQL